MMIADKSAPCSKTLTTTQEHFEPPKLKKPTVTRAKLYEKFLWQQLFDEYLRYNLREDAVVVHETTSEYVHSFGRDIPETDSKAKEELEKKYPLYYTPAITLWNHDGDFQKDFKAYDLESLFLKYANFPILKQDWNTEKCEKIGLSHINKWLSQAKLLPNVFRPTDTGLAYMEFNKSRLTYDEFLKFLSNICVSKDYDLNELKSKMISAGIPLASNNTLF